MKLWNAGADVVYDVHDQKNVECDV